MHKLVSSKGLSALIRSSCSFSCIDPHRGEEGDGGRGGGSEVGIVRGEGMGVGRLGGREGDWEAGVRDWEAGVRGGRQGGEGRGEG